MTMQISSNRLVRMALAKDKKLLTLEVDLLTLAEFAAAVKVFGARSYSSLLHQQVTLKIREAKNLVSEKEFNELVEKQKEEIQKRSITKAKERSAKSTFTGETTFTATPRIQDNKIQETEGVHRISDGQDGKKGKKDAQQKLNIINSDEPIDYGVFVDPDADLKVK